MQSALLSTLVFRGADRQGSQIESGSVCKVVPQMSMNVEFESRELRCFVNSVFGSQLVSLRTGIEMNLSSDGNN